MKKILIGLSVIGVIALTACNSGGKSSEKDDMSKLNNNSAQQAGTESDKDVTVIAPSFSGLDQNAAASIHTIIQHYLHVKNALANDNSSEASNGGKAMAAAMIKVDKSLLTADQKKVYDENEEDLKEHAEHIDKNSGNIEHQREHFAMMSEDVYSLAKAFGGGHVLYHDHCPMYNKNKGAMWLSETFEIKNPYYGSKMPKCGKVQEKIK